MGNKTLMQELHNKLMEKGGVYSKWHKAPASQIIQWLFLVVVVVSVGGLLINRMQDPNAVDYGSVSSAHEIAPPKGGIMGAAKDHILVKFKDNVGTTKAQEVLASHNQKALSEISQIKVKLVSVPANETAEEAVSRLLSQNSDTVDFAEVDRIVSPSLVPNDPWFPTWQGDRREMNEPMAWDTTTGDPSLIIAVADTGVSCTLEDLTGLCIPGWNFYNNNSDTSDTYGHGTAVTGILSSLGNNGIGVAGSVWRSKIMPLKVAAPDGTASYSAIASAVTYAADHGAKVVNNSYMSGGSPTVQSAGKYLNSKGGLLTVSEGNYGTNEGYSNSPYVISVSGVMPTGASPNVTYGTLYSWSNYGQDVDVSAPGCGFSTYANGSYSSFCGTSNAAPEAAGVLALIFSANPNLTPSQAQTILFNSAVDLGAPGYDIYYGAGGVDAGKAVALACTYPGANCGGTPPPADTAAPSVPTNLTASAPDSTKVNLSWTASTDNIGVAGYKISRNGVQINTTQSTTYTDASVAAGASYTYQVSAYDAAGNTSALSNSFAVTVPSISVDTTPPTVSITSPVNGAVIGKSASITIAVSAGDNIKVSKVEIYIDNKLITTDSSSPYSYKWNTKNIAGGSHTITAKAYDAAGNTSAASVAVSK